MPIAVPDGASVYVFGSVLHSAAPQDVDVLVVYDRNRIPPDTVHDVMETTFAELSSAFGLPVHPTLLTVEEEAGERFIERVNAVGVQEAQNGGSPRDQVGRREDRRSFARPGAD